MLRNFKVKPVDLSILGPGSTFSTISQRDSWFYNASHNHVMAQKVLRVNVTPKGQKGISKGQRAIEIGFIFILLSNRFSITIYIIINN